MKINSGTEDWDNIKYGKWQVVKVGLTRDTAVIDRVSQETGVDSRLLVTPLVVEQLRLMTSQRETFKVFCSTRSTWYSDSI